MGFLVRTGDGLIRFAPTRKVLKAADHAAFLEAQAVLEHARAEADSIVQAAKVVFEEERQRGHAEGLEEARMEAAERMIEMVGRSIDYFGSIETRVVDLVMTALRKILAEFDERDRVVLVVKNALAVVRNQKQVTLRLHPAQAEAVRNRVNELLAAYPAIGFLDVTPDPRLTPDTCILESEIGLVEAGIEAQLENIRRAFEKSLGSRHG